MKKMARIALLGVMGAGVLATGMLTAERSAVAQQATAKAGFVVEGDHFVLNGQPVQILSGEIHYSRIPREYWKARMEMAKAMGLNTIATYVFWNVHEPRPGVYDFSGNNDLAAFVRLAQEEHLNVLLRAGPYACAEWEMGGFPSWLLADPKMKTVLRTDDPAFMKPVERWITRLAKEVAPLQLGQGGPIIAVQIENEYGNFDHDKKYMLHMKEIFAKAGFTGADALLYTVDPSKSLAAGEIDGVYSGVNFGTGNAARGLTALAKERPGQPLFVTEYWPGWFDHWGHPHETRPTDKQVEDLKYVLSHKSSINIYMFHGGTSFGFMAGASWTNNEYLPDVTSYDYDAPLDEAGHATAKFYAYREVLAKYVDVPLPAVPEAPAVIAVEPFAVGHATSLWEHLPKAVESKAPLTMEAMGQAYGYVLYRKHLAAAAKGELVLDAVHDYARIYVDGKLAGTVDRRLKQDRIPLNAKKGARLDILVENSGRINSTKMMRGEAKGITHGVMLAGAPLEGWENYSLPLESGDVAAVKPGTAETALTGPHFAFASFDVKQTGDTFLDVSALGKGALWINGHALGRYWNEGPQKTLYVPGPWLREGKNSVVVFDLFDTAGRQELQGRATPILNAPIPDAAIAPAAAAPGATVPK
ncbi:MAG TPA: beta-galactosidase family protein [Acidobacteriaceae bacterium]